MLLFTIVEITNKLLGVVILAILSRILGVDGFVQYAAILLVFGYFYELSFFSYQSKNLVDANRNIEFLYSKNFIPRFWVLALASVVSSLTFILSSSDEWVLYVLPLALTLLLPTFIFDYYLYAKKLGRYIVISRFASQVLVCVLLASFYVLDISVKYILWVNFLQSMLLAFLIIYFSLKFGGFSIHRWFRNLIEGEIIWRNIWQEYNTQKIVFASKFMVLLIVSYEIALLSLIGVGEYNDMVLGNRVALILLPFLHFYLNSNISSVDTNNYTRYIMVNAIGVCVLVALSPIVVFVLFGEKFLGEGFLLNGYISLIIFQAYIN
ncbi:MAG: hypothetical protein RPR97_14010, partial [Colwellia sp.]